jgi:hypothetical protein
MGRTLTTKDAPRLTARAALPGALAATSMNGMPAAMAQKYPKAAPLATRRADLHNSSSAPMEHADAAVPSPDYPTASDDLGSPIAVRPYCDVIGVWLRDPLGPDALAELQSQCRGKLGYKTRKPRFRRDDRPELEYAQHLRLRQPSRAAIETLARRNDVLLTYSELALDRFFADHDETRAALQFVIEHALHKDRRRSQKRARPEMTICLGHHGFTLYWGMRGKAQHVAVVYADKKSKVAQSAIAPLHDERRTYGPQAHQRKGVGSLTELLNLDDLQFWNDSAHYYQLTDIEGLGRAYLNFHARQENPLSIPRRKAKITPIGNSGATYNHDVRMGHQLIRVFGLFKDAQIKLPRGAKQRDHWQYKGYASIYAARSIQNVYDRLIDNLPMLHRYISRISVDGSIAPIGSSNANDEISCLSGGAGH